ncbi:hypothetical protein [Sphaerochaeta sp. PS]|uniref:hypothetical protein n=1 Tax=Sphaerochaeta sp. PS TaxID=3076336 RepID=UPI0028A42F90|nr:hypothetical protein [Sphaerochaeta sp. PS]MDT4761582.1 hypothetical protein [Sphaerochaeta sp. PS]
MVLSHTCNSVPQHFHPLVSPLPIINIESQKTLLFGVTQLFGQYQRDWPKRLAVLTLSAISTHMLSLNIGQHCTKGVPSGSVTG